ncbi:MAG: hypothetical protein JRI68_11335 [Deltaproteobacteria bacterium]|nr:hypothetical protein [Deltaproteobacteria bacterium]
MAVTSASPKLRLLGVAVAIAAIAYLASVWVKSVDLGPVETTPKTTDGGTATGSAATTGAPGPGSAASSGAGDATPGSYRIVDGRLLADTDQDGSLDRIDTPAKLDAVAAFSFTVFSDNKGNHVESDGFNRMVAWSAAADNHLAYLGNGDIVCPHSGYGPKSADLVDVWLPANPAFTSKFYPTVGDGENQYFAGAQRHWCGGRAMLQHVGILTFDSPPQIGRPKTVQDVRAIAEEDRNGDGSPPAGEPGCDYHAIIPADPYRLHLISFTYADEPSDEPDVQLTERSRRWLMERLRSIERKGADIVVVAAHSQCRWDEQLAPPRRERLFATADLILSSSCHTYQRWPAPTVAGNTALMVNSGQLALGENGFLRAHLVPGGEGPPVLVTRYIVADSDTEPWQNHSHSSGSGTQFTVIGGAAIQGGY